MTDSEHLAAQLEALKVGPASDPTRRHGTMMNIANVQRVERLVDAASVAGAKVVLRGRPIQDGSTGQGAQS
jgi:betaine-aldehyde dehydrogenase